MVVKAAEPLGAHTVVIVTENAIEGGDVELAADDRDGCRIGITYNRNVEMPEVDDLLTLWVTHYARIHAAEFTAVEVAPLPNLGPTDMLYAVRFGS